jgi:thiol-disulfide isomerase/thioredoxin
VFVTVLAMFPVLVLQTAPADKGPPRNGWMEKFTVIDNPLPAPRVPLSNGEGSQVLLSGFEGKVVLVNFWATWCTPCVREMPSIDKLQAKLGGKDFTVVTVNEDRDGAARAKPFLKKLGTTHLVLYVDSEMAMMRAFKVRGLPTSFLLDREGRIIGKLEGIAEWDTPEVEDLIRYYTKQTTPAQTSLRPANSG